MSEITVLSERNMEDPQAVCRSRCAKEVTKLQALLRSNVEPASSKAVWLGVGSAALHVNQFMGPLAARHSPVFGNKLH